MSAASAGLGSRIREHLDADKVVSETAREALSLSGVDSASIWLTTGSSSPRLALSLPEASAEWWEGPPPRWVVRSAASGQLSRGVHVGGATGVAVPVLAPRSGLLGVVYVTGSELDASVDTGLWTLATEAGFALENANLYEQAVAARDRAEAILGRVAEAVVVTDGTGHVLMYNEAAERIGCVDVPAGAHPACADALRLHRGERRLDCSSGCALLALAGETDTDLGEEVWRLTADGRRQPLLASATAIEDGDGLVAEVVHSLRDITRLKEADEAKTLFLATASHELKTPLTVIRGFAQLLEGLDLGSEGAMALKAVSRRAEELDKIVDRILLSSRIEAGRLNLSVSAVSVCEMLDERARAMALSRDRQIETRIVPGLPPALADGDAVVTIVDHLLDNAIKYTPDGGPVLLEGWASAGVLYISVSDSGVGMDAEQLRRCFDKFWQGEASDVRRFGGSGIGLYIVRSLVEAMEGTVEVESILGRGAKFTVALRLVGSEAKRLPDPDEVARVDAAERSTIREFMRQIGVPDRPQGRERSET